MYNKIDIRNVPEEKLDEIDLDTVDLELPPPDLEPNRQYYYIAKCRTYVRQMAEELGRTPYLCTQTFGCQMNARDSEKLEGILEKVGYQKTEHEEEADFVIYNTCTVRENANQRVYGRLGYLGSMKKKKKQFLFQHQTFQILFTKKCWHSTTQKSVKNYLLKIFCVNIMLCHTLKIKFI